MVLNLTKEDRVLRVINRQDVDYLPSHIMFSGKSRNVELSKAFRLESTNELEDYLENHLYFTMMRQDKPSACFDLKKEINQLHREGFCIPDWKNKVVYDNWGIGIKMRFGSFFVDFHPLQGKANQSVIKFMNKNLPAEVVFEKDLGKSVRRYKVPDINKIGNFSDWQKDLKKYSGKYLVCPSGYVGIYERSYLITGWEEFMTNILLKPSIIEELMDKVMYYKIEAAKKIIKYGFKVAHSGDDLGTQLGGFFSNKLFKKFFLPRLKKYWEVFNNAGIPVMLHSCGNIVQYIPDLIDIGLKILEPVQPVMDLKYLKREFGKDLIFFGGIDSQKLPFLKPLEVRDLTRDTIRILGKRGGLIISTSQEITNDVPIENIKILIETIKAEREIAINL